MLLFGSFLLTSAALTSSTKSQPASGNGKDTLISPRVDDSLEFRQLCNAQQIQCTKARWMGKQEGRGSLPVISNLSTYNWTMSHTASDHVHLCLQCLRESVLGNCLWKCQPQKQRSSRDTEQTPQDRKTQTAAPDRHQELHFSVFIQPLLLGLKEKQLCLFNPPFFCCNAKGLRKAVVLQIKGIQTTDTFLNGTVLQGQQEDAAKQVMS